MGPQDMNTATERETEQGIENGEQDHLLADIEEFDDGTDQRFYCLITGANRYNPSGAVSFSLFSPSICLTEAHSLPNTAALALLFVPDSWSTSYLLAQLRTISL